MNEKGVSPQPNKLIFLINVNMKGAGITLLGPDQNPGNHWTMATYDVLSNVVIYGDSSGQRMPDELMVKVSRH